MIETVTLRTNDSTDLVGLSVLDVTDKSYQGLDLPLWGVEKVKPEVYSYSAIDLFWGLIDPTF